MKTEKFKVLLYLKKSSPDKSGKTPIMGRITVGKTMVQFSCKLSCTATLWNPRESRLNGKTSEAMATNEKLDKLMLSINEAYGTLIERKQPFDAEAVKNMFQGSVDTQMTLLKLFDRHIEEVKARVGIDVSHRTLPNYPLLKQKENPPRSLSREEFEKIRDWEFEEHRWSHITTRDMFLFACYTGTIILPNFRTAI